MIHFFFVRAVGPVLDQGAAQVCVYLSRKGHPVAYHSFHQLHNLFSYLHAKHLPCKRLQYM